MHSKFNEVKSVVDERSMKTLKKKIHKKFKNDS